MKPLFPIIAIASPLIETVLFAGFPTILLIFLFQIILGLKAPHEPSWVRPFCFTVLAISCPMSVWWHWLSPQSDFVTLSEHHLCWRVSLSRWEWFRSLGCLALDELAAFSYRSDGLEPEPVECGKTTAEKLARLWLEVNLPRHDVAFQLKSGRMLIAERLLARFEGDDLRLLFTRLGAIAECQEIGL